MDSRHHFWQSDRKGWVSLRFLDRLLPNVNQCGTLPFLVPIGFTLFTGRPHGSKKKKGDLVLYSGDLFPTEARKPPSCPRSHSVNRKGKPTHPSAPLVDRRSVRFYEASKHSSLALINQELCRHSLRLPVVSDTSFFPTLHTPIYSFLR
ncbi:hypothetical protein VNO80_33976 [Phaseolus coccineus]|uniref:Uncharacterized protein n=1 Tax=Phaseolus coccineus TaxID=3886 RepID=A0AAN9KXZ8_PHACN